jgi:hypothetical protein
VRQLCTSGKRRQITLRPRDLHQTVAAAARAEQATAQWKALALRIVRDDRAGGVDDEGDELVARHGSDLAEPSQ